MSQLYDAFSKHFEVRIAQGRPDVQSTFRLRYEVYCVEKKFERCEEHPDLMEYDSHDQWSGHALIVQRRTGQTVASTRLVLAGRLPAGQALPIEAHCGHAFYPEFSPGGVPRGQVAEISRFAVVAAFRKRRGESATVTGLTEESLRPEPNEDERREAPHLTLGLFRATLALSVELGVYYWYAVMEPTLVRLLQRCGVNFRQIGADVDYHGLRRPCFVGIGEMLDLMKAQRPDIWGFMTADGALWPGAALASESGIPQVSPVGAES